MNGENKGNNKKPFPELAGMFQHNPEIKKSGEKYRRSKVVPTASENFYKIIFENTGTATIILEEDNTIFLANQEFEKLTGCARKEVEGRKKWMEVVHRKDDLEKMKEYHRLRLIDPLAAPRTYEFQLVKGDGQVKDIVATVVTIPGTRQTLMTLLDITDRKQMETALKESERRLADTIDFLPDATFAVDSSGKVIAWNRAIENMTGVKAEEILGKGNYEYTMAFYGIRRPMLIDLVFGFIEEIEKKYKFIKREGNMLLAEADVPVQGIYCVLMGKAGPLYDSNGNIIGAIESIRDITEVTQAEKALRAAKEELQARVGERTAELLLSNKALQKEIFQRERTEEILKESEEKYNQFFKTSRDCIFITLADGKFIDMNDALMEMLGYSSREDMKRANVRDLYDNQKDRIIIANYVAKNGYVQEYPAELLKKDGSRIYVLITAVARYDGNGRTIGFQGTIRNVTEQRRNEEERERLIQELREAISQVKTLSGLLPICASCKKIRDDNGYWNQIESYIRDHSEAKFSHSICPECAKILYPELHKEW